MERRARCAQTSSRKTLLGSRTLAVAAGIYSRSGVGEQASIENTLVGRAVAAMKEIAQFLNFLRSYINKIACTVKNRVTVSVTPLGVANIGLSFDARRTQAKTKKSRMILSLSVFDDGVSKVLAEVQTEGDYLAVCTWLQGVQA